MLRKQRGWLKMKWNRWERRISNSPVHQDVTALRSLLKDHCLHWAPHGRQLNGRLQAHCISQEKPKALKLSSSSSRLPLSESCHFHKFVNCLSLELVPRLFETQYLVGKDLPPPPPGSMCGLAVFLVSSSFGGEGAENHYVMRGPSMLLPAVTLCTYIQSCYYLHDQGLSPEDFCISGVHSMWK